MSEEFPIREEILVENIEDGYNINLNFIENEKILYSKFDELKDIYTENKFKINEMVDKYIEFVSGECEEEIKLNDISKSLKTLGEYKRDIINLIKIYNECSKNNNENIDEVYKEIYKFHYFITNFRDQ